MKANLKQPAWPGSSHTLEEFAWGITDIQGRDYITVDCRLAMARVEHREAGKKLEITTSEIRPDIDRKGDLPMLVVQVVLESEIYGRAVGTATADISAGARAVDATNPVENAETSAVGRALGFYGYGTLQGQSGIASAEEVRDAKRRPTEAQRPAQQSQAAPAGEWKEWQSSKFPAKCSICGQDIPLDMPRLRNAETKKSKHIVCPAPEPEAVPEEDAFNGADDFEDIFGNDDPLAGPA